MRQTVRFLLLALASMSSLYVAGIASPHSSAPLAPIALNQEGEITEANWMQHPKIKEIRTIVQNVKTGMTKKALKVSRRAFEYCEPGADTTRMLAVNMKGQARFYQNEGGSEDSSLKLEHYYDEMGRLRFVFITGGAVNGSQLEHRIYFDAAGNRIWEKQTYKKGPGYTFPTTWPDDELQLKDAPAKFASTSPCPEERANRRGRRRG